VLGLTYSAHPVACAAGLETLKVYEDENLIENAAAMGRYVDQQVELLKEKHPCIGDFRNTGSVGLSRAGEEPRYKRPMAPFNATPDQMVVMNQVAAGSTAGHVYFCTLELCLYRTTAVRHPRAD